MYLIFSIVVFFLAMAAIALQDRFPSFLVATSTDPILCDRRKADCHRRAKVGSHAGAGKTGLPSQPDVC